MTAFKDLSREGRIQKIQQHIDMDFPTPAIWVKWLIEEYAVLEARYQQAMEALDRLADQAQRYMDASEQYFSDTTYDENGLLAEAHAELHGTLYDLRRARAALKGKT